MKIWQRIKKLSFKQLIKLGLVFIKRPLLIAPTLKASTRAMQISQKHYGNAQHKSGKPNAFRHAIWNVLLAKIAYKDDVVLAIQWADNVTTLHEKLAPNEPLETAMDLHNNKIGRQLFSEVKSLSEDDMIQHLKGKTEDAKPITKPEDVEKHLNDLVYI